MRKTRFTGGRSFLATLFLSTALAASTFGQASITLNFDQPGHKISPTLWGIFFEDINNSTDGGLYPELVRNRSFEDSDRPDKWKLANGENGHCEMHVFSGKPLNAFNRQNLKIAVDGPFRLSNEGYWGMNIVQGESYHFHAAVRAEDGFSGPISVRLISSSETVLAHAHLAGFSGDWHYINVDLTAGGSDPKARLELMASGHGALYLDMVSLIPRRTWKGHGLREDLAESIAALRPSFLRFPGGCWVEGDDFAHMNHWKSTIGNIDTRTPLWNIWGYNATQGLGFFEYLQLAEDLGATPLFDINVGMSHHEVVSMDRMDQWVQDALDAVEYANGPTNSVWGARRAASGHPEPFKLKYMEIGNENGGPEYVERWPLLVNAIRARYPEIQFIVNTDLRNRPYPTIPAPDIVDEHYYESPEAFMNRAAQFDHYDRKGPKIFVGEYAVTRRCGKGNLRAALGEAAFMTGLERNSDIVVMASYAPLFVNLNHRAWNPDLINFDSSMWYGLPGYYVQQLFGLNCGDVTVPLQVDSPTAHAAPDKGMIGVGTWKTQAEFKDLRVTDAKGKDLFVSDFGTGTNGWRFLGEGRWEVMNGALRQSAEAESVRALAGRVDWSDYTLTLKARKLAGQEGFLILFHIADDEDRTWWNVGGWQNTGDGLENDGVIDRHPERIETGRWYDLKVQVRGNHVQCHMDGRLVHDLDLSSKRDIRSLYATASKDIQSGDVILKVVNVNEQPLSTSIRFKGASNLTGRGTAFVLSSQSGMDENS